MNWTSFVARNTTCCGGVYANGVVSTPNIATNPFGGTATFTPPGGFNFLVQSGYWSAAANDAQTLNLSGFVDGIQTNFHTQLIDTTGPALITLNWFVDEVRIVTFGGVNAGRGLEGAFWQLDNLQVSGVPEPGTLALLGAGLLGLGLVARRRRVEKVKT